jgi:hypothetical protein
MAAGEINAGAQGEQDANGIEAHLFVLDPVPGPDILLASTAGDDQERERCGRCSVATERAALPLTSGASSGPIPYYAHEPQVALIERGNCLYTYPRPDYSALPKGLRNYKPFTAVIRPDMSLAIHLRQKNGIEGPEIVAGGFPLKPTTFCGRRGGG